MHAPGFKVLSAGCRGGGRPPRPEEEDPVELDGSMGSEVWAPVKQVATRVGSPAEGAQGCRERVP